MNIKPVYAATIVAVLSTASVSAQEADKLKSDIVPMMLAYTHACPSEAWMDKMVGEVVAIVATQDDIVPEEVRRRGDITAKGYADALTEEQKKTFCEKARPALMAIYDESRPKPSFAQKILGTKTNQFIDAAVVGAAGAVIGVLAGFIIGRVSSMKPLRKPLWIPGWILAFLILRMVLLRTLA
ncbi:hypothetical protein IHQ71_28445 [Rhizobium sp. TH2]|uniref:hypothetical protein n=1 Tax=Rhizobium sp. TH2 TaxID=2775403 RepID=UPI0021584962|nr:hypothetical protein [Rhizobium sp. TH2]UVC08994.1 hypothetical protein IHQ71_28445 [Rhizobium sp. TH2]